MITGNKRGIIPKKIYKYNFPSQKPGTLANKIFSDNSYYYTTLSCFTIGFLIKAHHMFDKEFSIEHYFTLYMGDDYALINKALQELLNVGLIRCEEQYANGLRLIEANNATK